MPKFVTGGVKLSSLSSHSRPNVAGRIANRASTSRAPHGIAAFGYVGEYAAKLTKGAHVQIEGEIHTREYTPKGEPKKSITEVRVRQLAKLDRPNNAEPPGATA